MRALNELRDLFIYNGVQIKDSLQLSGVVSFYGVAGVKIMELFNIWWIENVDFFVIAMFLVAVDHVLGSIVHKFYKKDFNWRSNGVGLLIKISMVLMGMIVFEGLTHITKDQSLIYDYLKMVTRLVILLYPARSIWNNMHIVSRGKFPPASLTSKYNKFWETLDLKDIKNENKN